MLFASDGYNVFLEAAKVVGNALVSELGCGVVCDAVILQECYSAAKHSITFHGQGESANHIKQAGHCCFWLSKLKPLKLSTGFVEFARLVYAGDRKISLDERFEVSQPKASAALQNAAYPLNEAFALSFGHKIAVDGLRTLQEEALRSADNDRAERIVAGIKMNETKFVTIAQRVSKSLRINNHSARSVAAMFEWVYFDGDE